MKGENRRVRLSFKLSSNQQNAKLNFSGLKKQYQNRILSYMKKCILLVVHVTQNGENFAQI